ncbi:uncharacterized protein BX663DRAFT_503545 [Cokeromyces recurvatus]|uniref:uncharacterized protein n=1 Tax=Cokeromyces recurvatus TaxID=90255 RepID=UPI00221F3523|nr:uncharacterized protein BX663DRAFT_503545 [Cokeromyces recurvatus]KAI7904791.1 hypothetical protein BX663DRAFT_503545 [Cokeromyces recurvatus]
MESRSRQIASPRAPRQITRTIISDLSSDLDYGFSIKAPDDDSVGSNDHLFDVVGPLFPNNQEIFQATNTVPITAATTREERLHVLSNDAMQYFLPATASFFAEKLMMSTDSLDDAHFIALSYYQQQDYQRALEVLNKRKTLSKSVICRYLAALCSIALGKGKDALDYLGHRNPFSDNSKKRAFNEIEVADGHIKLDSIMCYARGRAYLLLKDIDKARECFKEALTIDVKCYDALESLIMYNMMNEKEEWEFVTTLPYEEHCGPDSKYFRYLYGLKLKTNIMKGKNIDPDVKNITKSLDVQLSIAEGYYNDNRFEDCLKICKEIRKQDAFFKESIPLYLACLYELGNKIELYEYAQLLVNKMNTEAVAWHAVGLYYLHIKNHMEARKYFNHALTINNFFQQAWLGYGHSFSAVKDYDQAINAYNQCSKLIPESYLPLMNIAIQHMGKEDFDAAYIEFKKSVEKCTSDPFLYNEFAVCCYKLEQYEEAREHLHAALKLAKERQSQRSPIWEKIWCNLGHIYRQQPLQNHNRALKCFENALSRNPRNSDARAAAGMIYQLKGNIARAIVEYHEALKNSDTKQLIEELIKIALESNVKMSYVANDEYPYLNDNIFDISQIPLTNKETKNEIDLELDENYWMRSHEKPVSNHKRTRDDFSPPASTEIIDTEDDLIIDEGDLRPEKISRILL